MHVLVAGCGWLGTAVAKALLARGDRVTGVRRSPASAAGLAQLGVAPLALDLAAADAASRLPAVDAVIACQAAGGDGPGAYRATYVDANRTLLAAARGVARAFVYTGSTGVFGQQDGSDVDEATQPQPASPTAQVLVEAEALVREASTDGSLRTCVVRLSGLYGPGRAGVIDRVRSGRLALGPGDGAWMNFCHQEDAVAVVLAALDRGVPGAVYHGSDAQPPRRREVVEWVAARLGIDPPRTNSGPPGPDRRVLSAWTRRQLDVELRQPSFRDGLAGLLSPL